VRRKKILCVDDAKLFLEIERKLLDRTEADLLFAASGAEGLKVAIEQIPDLVLLDFNLGDITGDKICAHIKADPRTSDVPVLMVTTKARVEDIERCRAAGCDDFAPKPLRHQELLAKVAALLRIPHRVSQRVMVRLEAEIVDREMVSFGNTADLSESGMSLEASAPLAIGSEVRLRFLLPHEGEVEAIGSVVRERPLLFSKHDYGIRFLHVSPEMEDRLRGFLAFHPVGAPSD
jgi:CheY-like chemotaxis protein